MSKGRERWPRRDLRQQFPLAGERQTSPRFDGIYASADEDLILRFRRDGAIECGDQDGDWKVDDGELLLTTSTCQCSGAIDQDGIYLLCTVQGEGREGRSQHKLRFRPGH